MELVFFDTEFTTLNSNAQLISLAFVAFDNRAFYAEFNDYTIEDKREFLDSYVLPKLWMENKTKLFPDLDITYVLGNSDIIASEAKRWLNLISSDEASIQVWADCPVYDWVLFFELFGGALGENRPQNLHFLPMDIEVLFNEYYLATGTNFCEVYPPESNHNALVDAVDCKKQYLQFREWQMNWEGRQ